MNSQPATPQGSPPAKGTLEKQIEDAVWAGDTETLHELAPCRCCCHEHTFESCVARRWFGCRGQGSQTLADEESWWRLYMVEHGIDIFK